MDVKKIIKNKSTINIKSAKDLFCLGTMGFILCTLHCALFNTVPCAPAHLLIDIIHPKS